MYRRRWLVLGLWAVVVLLALPIAPLVFRSLTAGGFGSPDLEAFRASQLLAERFGTNPSDLVLVFDDPSGQLAADDPRFGQAVAEALTDLRRQAFVQKIVSAEE